MIFVGVYVGLGFGDDFWTVFQDFEGLRKIDKKYEKLGKNGEIWGKLTKIGKKLLKTWEIEK